MLIFTSTEVILVLLPMMLLSVLRGRKIARMQRSFRFWRELFRLGAIGWGLLAGLVFTLASDGEWSSRVWHSLDPAYQELFLWGSLSAWFLVAMTIQMALVCLTCKTLAARARLKMSP